MTTSTSCAAIHKPSCRLRRRNTLPTDLRFVTSDFLTESLAAKELQDPQR